MKALFATLIFIFGFQAQAVVPYPELNKLREQSVITRVVSDNPSQAWIKKCVSVDSAISAGSSLALAMDGAAAGWKKMEIKKSDIPALSQKISVCELRGSCQVYDAFLNAVQADKSLTEDILKLKDVLGRKMETLTAKSFVGPFREIKKPCTVLKNLIKP